MLLELAKKFNAPHRNGMKTKKEFEEAIKDTITKYKKIIFGSDTPSCMMCLIPLPVMEDTVRKHVWEGLQKIIVMDGGTMIDKRTSEVFDPEVDSTYWKDKC